VEIMATLTVRNLDDETRDALKAQGVRHGRSMEAEARVILSSAVRDGTRSESKGLGTWIHELFQGLDFEVPERSTDLARAATFDE
jgi:plasmid stability protein